MALFRVSDRTSRRLFRHAHSFEDTPEMVIEALLDQLEGGSVAHKSTTLHEPGDEEMLPEGEYWLPILETLVESGGSGKGRDVIDKLETQLGPRLTRHDHGVLEMGETRWRNRARFARLRMKEKGLISSDSPRGFWEITDEGRRYLNERLPG
ncbi:MAG TPA: winged helix-turn-helix domain-containing protein [Solirubrobacterales bacterium]